MIATRLAFPDFEGTESIRYAIESRIEKLERFFDRILRCEVVVTCPHKHRQQDRLYTIHIHMALPGKDIYINRDPNRNEAHRDIYVAIRDAFDAAERSLKKRVRILRKEIKRHRESRWESPADDLELYNPS